MRAVERFGCPGSHTTKRSFFDGRTSEGLQPTCSVARRQKGTLVGLFGRHLKGDSVRAKFIAHKPASNAPSLHTFHVAREDRTAIGA
jgi:hypothetical protein